MISNDHNKDEQERSKFQTNHNVLEIKVNCSRLTYLLDLYHEIKLTATECMPRYSLLVQTKVHHNIAIDAQRTKGY